MEGLAGRLWNHAHQYAEPDGHHPGRLPRHATLTFYLWISTQESGSTAYDKLTVKAGSTTLATYSNVNATSGYVQKALTVSAQAR